MKFNWKLSILAGLMFIAGFAPSSAPAQDATTSNIKVRHTEINKELTALDKYVAAPDPSYKWELKNTIESPQGTLYVIDLTSQTWLTEKEVNRTVWQHWLLIFKPTKVSTNKALMFIGGGANGGEAPKSLEQRIAVVATATQSVVAELKQVPNQPLIFHNDGKPRVEDDLIGYTWDQYIKTGDEKWPARLPMTKSVVRAMDTVETFMASDAAGKLKVNEFVVSGGSKRGWTTWTTAAVDKRVIAIAPLVIDVLNLDPSMRNHFASYGFWAPAIDEYVEHRIMQRREFKRYGELMQLEDPFAYRNRYTMPKCIINATGDQFFCPDSSQFYFDELPGEKNLCYVPNTEHSLKESNAVETLVAFHYSIVNGKERPKFDWKFDKNKLTVHCQTKPSKVFLWQALNPNARDFRVDTIGRAYKSTELSPTGDGKYEAELVAPEKGWQASFVQCEFDVGAPVPMRLSTSVKILPETLPYLAKPIPVDKLEPGQ